MDALEIREFAGLMPHRIRIRGTTALNDYGRPIAGAVREYACLLDDSVIVEFSQASTQRVPEQVAYVLPHPITGGSFAASATVISTGETLILADDSEHEIVSVATHYDESGEPHNQEIRYS